MITADPHSPTFPKELQEKVNALFNKNKTNIEKERNEIFEWVAPTMDYWIKVHLKKRKYYMSKSERLSLCWDCFEFCLKHYSPNQKISVINHFYKYTFFFLLSWFQARKKEEELIDFNISVDEIHRDGLSEYFEQIDGLKQFRELLPDDYKLIFDDAILSIAGGPSDHVPYTRKKYPYGYYKYCESKKVFKIVVDFLLRR